MGKMTGGGRLNGMRYGKGEGKEREKEGGRGSERRERERGMREAGYKRTIRGKETERDIKKMESFHGFIRKLLY
jgi:hypothetical protein